MWFGEGPCRVNLLNYICSDETKFINAVMSQLFTKEERMSGIIVDDPDKSKSKKSKLDPSKVDLLKGNFD